MSFFKMLFRGENKDVYVERMCENYTAQEIHDKLMDATGGETGTTPGYSKATMASILYHVHD